MPPITIQIVTWNSAAALPRTLAALHQVDPSIAVIRIIDNASTDESVTLVKNALPQADVVLLPTNTGFAGGHNAGFAKCATPFVLVLNPDVELAAASLPKTLRYFADERVGALQGKLYRSGTTIDSTGISMSFALNGYERGAGEVDAGHYGEVANIAAATGAAALYRLSALQEISHGHGEVFDQDFWAYKEDVDLGWRLRRRGWKVLYVPVVAGVHPRRLKAERAMGWPLHPRRLGERLRDQRTRYSVRNWVWLLIKNASMRDVVIHSPALLARALVLLLFSLLYWPLLTVWFEIMRGAPAMIAKRGNSG